MKCPRCHDPLLTLEHEGLELDYCDQCQGIWLDAGELHNFAQQSGPNSILRELVALRGRARWLRQPRCPICRRSMRDVRLTPPRSTEIQLDRCGRGCGIWFDRGELGAVLEHSPLGEHPKLRHALQNFFKQSPNSSTHGDRSL